MLNSDFFYNNRRQLCKRVLSEGVIIITANGLLQRSGDTTFPFQQDSSFFYLTGLSNLADALLVMDGVAEFLILPKRSKTEDIFGGTIDCDKIAEISGIQEILSYEAGWIKMHKLRQSSNNIYTLGTLSPKISSIDSFYTQPTRRRLIRRLQQSKTSEEIHDIRSELVKLRQIKQVPEIAMLQQAITITKAGFAAAKQAIRVGIREYEIEAEFDYIFKKHNAIHGYTPPIIAAGSNACALHYSSGSQALASGEYLLLDVGAEYAGYTADITRVYPVTTVSNRHLAVFEAVRTVQQRAIEVLHPGLEWLDYVQQVEQFMGEELLRLKLITQPTREQVRKYFPHGISHSLGIDAHDVCEYRTIEEGMVITVEPGIYIADEYIGVRLEDDILITDTGALNLSKDIPY